GGDPVVGVAHRGVGGAALGDEAAGGGVRVRCGLRDERPDLADVGEVGEVGRARVLPAGELLGVVGAPVPGVVVGPGAPAGPVGLALGERPAQRLPGVAPVVLAGLPPSAFLPVVGRLVLLVGVVLLGDEREDVLRGGVERGEPGADG